MNSEAESILSNLRLLALLPNDQWIITERTGNTLNVIGYCHNTIYNNFYLAICQDGWAATHECLKSLYCERLPRLITKLLDLPDESGWGDVNRLSKILEDSIDGLKKIREIYDDPCIKAHMDSIMFDFADALVKKIKASQGINDGCF